MRIRYVRKTGPTGRLMTRLIPERLQNKPIIFNFGSSESLNCSCPLVFNTPEAVYNASNKKRMFRMLIDSDIDTLDFIDLSTDRQRAINLLRQGKELVLREGKTIRLISPFRGGWQSYFRGKKWKMRKADYQRLMNSNGYVTVKEDKLSEYRVIVWNKRILKTYIKIPKNPYREMFKYKFRDCTFRRICHPDFSSDMYENIIESVNCLGLDLAGIDILINTDGVFKIIEVNSSPGMSEKTINHLYRRMLNSKRVRRLY
ncbi:MAG: hypothetical protein IH948_00130 [Bacteroidetes bacterium]|nr:hypothetical protein [Bacteroidota bacterium]